MKKIALGLVGLIVICAIGLYAVLSNLDYLIKSAVEKYGSQATQASVTLDSVKLALTSGEGTLTGLSVGNPKGFSSAKAFYLGSINVQVDPSSIRGTGPIVINKIVIDKPQVTYELLNSGSSNLQAIQTNTQDYAGSAKSAEADPSAPQPVNPKAEAGSPNGRKVIIKDLDIRSGQISISQELLKGRQLSTGLPEIHLTNIGQSSGGATAAEVAQQIFGSISSTAGAAAIKELATEKISGVLKNVPASAIGGAALDNVGSQLKGVFK